MSTRSLLVKAWTAAKAEHVHESPPSWAWSERSSEGAYSMQIEAYPPIAARVRLGVVDV